MNDQYGHFVGDRLIKECAKLLGEVCGTEGRSYRLGGDEFAILVSGPIAGNILEGICHTLLSRLAEPMLIDDRKLTIGASVGLSRSSRRTSCPPPTAAPLGKGLYRLERRRKHRCTWFSAISTRTGLHPASVRPARGAANEIPHSPTAVAPRAARSSRGGLLRWPARR